MLVTMSFSIELFLSVVAGLMVGNLLFITYSRKDNEVTQQQRRRSQRSSRNLASNGSGGGADDANPETSPLLASTAGATANLRRRG